MRGINEKFTTDLKYNELSWVFEQVKSNKELCLEIRKNYINIYYKGGNALKITQYKGEKGYQGRLYKFEFDIKYCLDENNRTIIGSLKTSDDYKNNFKLILSEMDNWFKKNSNTERKIQQEFARHNKNEFCIIDIEYTVPRERFRLDMVAVHKGKLVIVENKVNTKTVGEKSGIKKHYHDICGLIDEPAAKESFTETMKTILNNKIELGLISKDIVISSDKIEILFLIFDCEANINNLNKSISEFVTDSYPAKFLYLDSNKIGEIKYDN